MRHLEGRYTALMFLAALLLGGCSPKEYSEATQINGEQAGPARNWPMNTS